MSIDNPNCDGEHCQAPSTSTHGEVRVLPYGGGGNLIVCRQCYEVEMIFRRQRIREGVPFDLPTWDSLRRYET